MRAFLSAAVLCLLSSPALATIAISTAAISVPAITLGNYLSYMHTLGKAWSILYSP